MTWFSFAFQSEQPSGMLWLATSNNSSCCSRWGGTRILPVHPEYWGVPMAPGHGLQLLFSSSESRKPTPPQKSALRDKQGLCNVVSPVVGGLVLQG